jgi:hypothetical protein
MCEAFTPIVMTTRPTVRADACVLHPGVPCLPREFRVFLYFKLSRLRLQCTYFHRTRTVKSNHTLP